MPVPTDITAGTLTITNGSTAVTGVGTSWLASDLRQGDVILWIEGGDGFQTPILADVPASNTALTLVEPWEGPTLTGVRYRIRYQWDSSRVSAQSRQLIELLDNGNILALASLTGPGVPVFDGPHSMTIRPETDFINGVAYDVQVDTLPDRAAYDGQAAGFSVLVSDVGDGRSAVYSKASNTSGDWTAPAYVTGPVGPAPVLEAGTTTRGPLDVEIVPVGPGYELNLTVPINVAQGDYSGATAYLTGDIVQSAGSSWVALQSTTGNAPPSLPMTANAYWQLLARAGNDGAGTVTTVAEGNGIDVDSTDPTMPVVSLATVPTATVKGRVAAGTGVPTDLTGAQLNTILPVFSTVKGLVPGATSGDATAGRLLAANGAWVDPPTNADLEFTVAQIMMRLADIDNVAQFLGPNGNRFADSYDTLTYVDVAGATNLSTTTLGVLKPTTSGTTTTLNVAASTAALQGSTVFDRSASLPSNKLIARVGIFSSTARTISLKIALQTSSTNFTVVWTEDFAHPGGGWADHTPASPYTTPATGVYNVGAYMAPGGAIPEVSTAMPRSYMSGNAGIGVPATYVADSNQVFPTRYTVDLAANNLTVSSTSFSAPSAPTKMKSLLNVREVDAAVAGTDYLMDVSRDGGTTWTAVTLTERYSLPSGLRVVEGAETSVAGQPSGSAPRYRLRTANNKNVEFHDTYLYWTT